MFSPNAGKQRLLRSYDSGDISRLNSGWIAVNNSAENDNQPYRDRMRARARDLEKNSEVLNSIISTFERNVISTGIELQPKIMLDDDNENVKLNRQILEKWWQWAENCDIAHMYNFEEIQRIVLRRKIVDGGIIILKTYSKKNGFRLQLKEVDSLDTALFGENVYSGIETDKFGKVINYHFTGNEKANPNNVIFIANRNRPMQVREITPIASVMSVIAHLNSYMEAVTVKERLLACFGVAITRQNDVRTNGRALTIDKQSGYPEEKISPGMKLHLQPGESVTAINPTPGSGSNIDDFIKVLLRLIGASLGISYESISRDMSNSTYSSARQALLDDQRTFKVWQDELIYKFCREVYRSWLDFMVLSGEIDIPDYYSNSYKYQNHVWIPPGWSWIDPLKDIKASQYAVSSGMDTLANICAENGKDWRETMQQIKVEQDYAKKLGIELGGIYNYATNSTAITNTDNTSNDNKAKQ